LKGGKKKRKKKKENKRKYQKQLLEGTLKFQREQIIIKGDQVQVVLTKLHL